MALLGIDVGTSGCKVIAFDEDGHVLAIKGMEYEPTVCGAGLLEVSPDAVWASACACIKSVATACRSETIRALAVSSFGEAAVPVDQYGRALGNGILFIDPRGQEQLEALIEKIEVGNLSLRTGLPIHRMYTLLRLMWLRDKRPEVYRDTVKYLQFAEFVNFRLTGRAATDYSLAARTMAFNIVQKAWDGEILDAARIPAGLFAEALPSGTPIGPVLPAIADELGLPRDTLVATGGHDQPCAALGSGTTEAGMAIDGIGTSECITTSFKVPVLDPKLFAMNYHCGPHTVPGRHITFAYTMSAGGLLQWFRDSIGRAERDEAAHLHRSFYDMMNSRIGSDPSGLLVLPHLDGSGTPSLDPESRGAILGLSRKTTTEQIYRACMEGITFEMRLNLECLGGLGIHVDSLRMAGGGAKSEAWLQMKADILNRPLATLETDEAGALGAAILAGIASGVYRDIGEACLRTVREKHRFEPDHDMSSRYEESYERYKRLYPAIKTMWK